MAGIFDSLYTAYSGLQTSQYAVNVTSHNISNAENDGYTRQRAVLQAKLPMNTRPGDVGTGVEVLNTTRLHDEFVYKRYKDASTQQEFTNFEEKTLTEVSKYFPDIQNSGVAEYLKSYFDSWQAYANNPSDSTQAIVVAKDAQNLANIIKDTREYVSDLQNSLNEQVEPLVNEINRLAEEIANLNEQIFRHESNGVNKANDLRDERDKRETALSKLVNLTVSKNGVTTDMMTDTNVADLRDDEYTMLIGGYPLVDGATFHPLVLKADTNSQATSFNAVNFEYQDYTLIDISDKITGGKLGAIMDLRGYNLDETGRPTKGKLQEYIDKLDTLASGFIQSMNNVYAGSATKSMTSNEINSTGNELLATLPQNFKTGSFDFVVYKNDGTEALRRKIDVDIYTDTLNTIASKINAVIDDNGDGNANNDLSSYFSASFVAGQYGQFSISQTPTAAAAGYRFALSDSSTTPSNFAGATGLGRLFDGSDAKNISLKDTFLADPSLIHPYANPTLGNNAIANAIVQLQYQEVGFINRDKSTTSKTIASFYTEIATLVATHTDTAIKNNDSAEAAYNAVNEQYQSVSKVSTDEELMNLIKFQAGYSASAKVVTTLDQMINTLLGIKQ